MHQAQASTLLDDHTLSPPSNLFKSGVGSAQLRPRARQTALQGLDRELQLAGAMQRNLHSPPPSGNGVQFHVLYRPAGAVSGDTYDVTRLTSDRVSIALADATGHDLSAALLSVFVKRSLHGRDHNGPGSRLLDPDEVLTRANDDLIAAGLTECQFVTALYALYNETTRVLRWARAGAPYPILLRTSQSPQRLPSNGPLLGVLPHAKFEVIELQLRPGDTVLFHTDGLETLPSHEEDAIHHGAVDTDWISRFRGASAGEILRGVENALDNVKRTAAQHDDVTIAKLSVDQLTPNQCSQPRQGDASQSSRTLPTLYRTFQLCEAEPAI